jgi:hypothetical protein
MPLFGILGTPDYERSTERHSTSRTGARRIHAWARQALEGLGDPMQRTTEAMATLTERILLSIS